jgi:PD-(D/E)XK endonuclease
MHKKEKGAIGELVVAAHCAREGWHVLFPYGENCRYDLVIERNGIFKRIQVKYSTPKNGALRVNCRSSNNWSVLKYTAKQIDMYGVYDPSHHEVYFIPIEIAEHKSVLNIRIEDPKNNQQNKVHLAKNFREIK